VRKETIAVRLISASFLLSDFSFRKEKSQRQPVSCLNRLTQRVKQSRDEQLSQHIWPAAIDSSIIALDAPRPQLVPRYDMKSNFYVGIKGGIGFIAVYAFFAYIFPSLNTSTRRRR
jgi:hypothetical protein